MSIIALLLIDLSVLVLFLRYYLLAKIMFTYRYTIKGIHPAYTRNELSTNPLIVPNP